MDDLSQQLKNVKSSPQLKKVESLQEIVSNRIAISNATSKAAFDLDVLPPNIKEYIEIEIAVNRDKFIHTAFKSISRFLDRLPHDNPKKFSLYYENKSRCDITAFLWHLRDQPNILTELGYKDYKLSLEVIPISPGTYNNESQYNLTIEQPSKCIKAIYTSILGRFD